MESESQTSTVDERTDFALGSGVTPADRLHDSPTPFTANTSAHQATDYRKLLEMLRGYDGI